MKLMSWCFLFGCNIIYLLLGAFVFMMFEQDLHPHPSQFERRTHKKYKVEWDSCANCGDYFKVSDLQLYLSKEIHNLNNVMHEEETDNRTLTVLRRLEEYIRNSRVKFEQPKSHHKNHNDSMPDDGPDDDDGPVENLSWDFYNSAVFAFTIITTIGYGFHTPKSDASRIFSVFYGLFGIPLHMILVREMGDYLSRKLEKAPNLGSKTLMFGNKHMRFIFQISYYLLLGLLIVIILPAGLFVAVEDWSFNEAFYMAGITCLTIGFGDYVPGMMHAQGKPLYWLYKILIFVWIELGLGYLMMILSFVTRGLKHKNVRRLLQHKLLNFLHFEPVTDEELLEDVEFLQRVLGEPSLVKIVEHSSSDDDSEQAVKISDIEQECEKTHPGLKIHPPERERRPSRIMNDEPFHVPHVLLSAVVNVVRHGVIQEVLEAVQEDDEDMGGDINKLRDNLLNVEQSRTAHLSPARRRRRRTTATDTQRNSFWRLGQLRESVVSVPEFNRDGGTKDGIPGTESNPPKSPNSIYCDECNNEVGGGKKFSPPPHLTGRFFSSNFDNQEGEEKKRGRRQRKIGVAMILEDNRLPTSPSHSGKYHTQGRYKKASLAGIATANTRPPPPLTRHMSLQSYILDDFSRMLDNFHTKLKPPTAPTSPVNKNFNCEQQQPQQPQPPDDIV